MMSLKKIVLKNKTQFSLNERFTLLRRQNEAAAAVSPLLQQRVTGNLDNMRQARANLQRASAKNRRLALQMENRPAVAAALRIKKERLSLPTRARLGFRPRGMGAQRAVGGMRSATLAPTNRGRGAFQRQLQQQRVSIGGNFRASPGRGRARARAATRGGNAVYFRGRGNGALNSYAGYYNDRRGGRGAGFNARQQSPQRRGGFQQQQNRRGVQQGARRGAGRRGQRGGRGGQQQMRGGRGRARGRGAVRGGRGRQPVPTRAELDNQLDEYMAGTRAQLDRELDQYMNVQE
ncbi:hypothetical protein B566_EDAN002121 [Ephemera danica]|nr:hypothetical protein B566_EDAN002121 [Ephemera danica]